MSDQQAEAYNDELLRLKARVRELEAGISVHRDATDISAGIWRDCQQCEDADHALWSLLGDDVT